MKIKIIGLAALVLSMTTGCSGLSYHPRTYDITHQTKIVLMNKTDLERKARTYGRQDVNGFYVPSERTMYVVYDVGFDDKKGRPVPDMCVLGHEVWHLKELGGNWHGDTEDTYWSPDIDWDKEKKK